MQPLEDLLLKLDTLGRGLDHEVRSVHRGSLAARAREAADPALARLCCHFAAFDTFVEVRAHALERCIHRAGLRVVQARLVPRHRRDLRNAVTHGSGAEHGDASDVSHGWTFGTG